MRKLLYHDNVVHRTLTSLPVMYLRMYDSLCLQYAIKDPLRSRMRITESV